jgi:predicted MPP superfamily phosphohydrolase
MVTTMFVRFDWPRLVSAGVFLIAGCCAWLLAIHRWVIHWVDGSVKTVASALLLVVLTAGSALFGWTVRDSRWVILPTVGIGLVFVGEVRRAYLRHVYRACGPVEVDAPKGDLHGPITTTDLSVLRYALRLPDLQAQRIRIAHVTDMHVTAMPPASYYARVFGTAARYDPDILVLTGDFVSDKGQIPLLADVLKNVRARLGVFAVLGNHDYWTDAVAITEVLRAARIELLGGRCADIPLSAGVSVRLCGDESPWGPNLLGLGEPSALNVVLTHTPDNIYRLGQEGADIVFAGHNHGGQINLPLLGSLVVPSIYGRRFDRGHFLVNNSHLLVSAGVGAAAPPVRIYCNPELLIVDVTGPSRE